MRDLVPNKFYYLKQFKFYETDAVLITNSKYKYYRANTFFFSIKSDKYFIRTQLNYDEFVFIVHGNWNMLYL